MRRILSFGALLWLAACAAETPPPRTDATPFATAAAPAPAPQETVPPAPPPPAAPMAQVLPAPAPGESFEDWLARAGAAAKAMGVRPATVDAALGGLAENMRVIELDRQQRDVRPALRSFLAVRTGGALLNGGRARLASVPALPGIAEKYGVPASVLTAVWGIETHYGRITGSFDVVRSIASLAYEGRRGDLFRRELLAVLRILDEGHVTRADLLGSWAGAMGQSQFMPSSYLTYAADHDGDGKADIWKSEADALASIANYLRRRGWRPGERWGFEVKLPQGFDFARHARTPSPDDCGRAMLFHSAPKQAGEWRALGAVLPDGAPESGEWTLVLADGLEGPAFLTGANYRAILAYNCSNYYALSVALLADAIRR